MLGRSLAGATPCRRCTLTQLPSGTMAKMKASPAIALPAQSTLLGGPALSATAGSRPLLHGQAPSIKGLQGCSMFNKDRVLQADVHLCLACPGDTDCASCCILRWLWLVVIFGAIAAVGVSIAHTSLAASLVSAVTL